MWRGDAARAAGETRLNARSSRSHSVLSITVERQLPRALLTSAGGGDTLSCRSGDEGGSAAGSDDASTSSASGSVAGGSLSRLVTSRLHLVDLAGSERTASGAHGGSGAAGRHLREAAAINTSLSALGRVVSVLVQRQAAAAAAAVNSAGASGGAQQPRGHVPYRDSALTYLLQEALGGNSRTTFVGAVSPSAVCAKVRRAAAAGAVAVLPAVFDHKSTLLFCRWQSPTAV